MYLVRGALYNRNQGHTLDELFLLPTETSMKCQNFLLGVLSGLVLGVGATIASFALRSHSAPPSPPTRPITNPILLRTQSAPSGIPRGAQPREFNGKIYYIVPLEKNPA